jgi:hypothetical protein
MKSWKILGFFFLAGLALYAALMLFVRLEMTRTAYAFEDAKTHERGLQEEQARLKALIHEQLHKMRQSQSTLREPEPQQIHRLPEGL